MPGRGRNWRYGPWDDGPDPLAAPYDISAAVEDIGERILDGQTAADAVRDLMRQGMRGQRGLDEMRRRALRRAQELRNSGRMDGVLDQVRELLDEALEAERKALFADPDDDARLREARLGLLPDSTAQAVRELSDYDWKSAQAQKTYEQIRELLQQQVLDAQFRGMREALQQQDPAGMQRMKDAIADLNQLLEKRAAGTDTEQEFRDFMDKHGELFPDQPESLDELLDSMARQAAAMSRLMASLSPEQQQELADLMQQAWQDMDLASEMSRLSDNLRALRPDMGWDRRARMDGDESMSLPDATDALAELSDLEQLSEQLSQDYPGAELADIDEEAVRRALGRSAVDDVERLKQIERELERQGYLVRREGRLELSPKSARAIGQAALRKVFATLDFGARGEHDVRASGANGELTGTTREWRYGDEQPLEVVRTLTNSIRRDISQYRNGSLKIEPVDFEIRETETRSRAAVALLVDQSFSMVMNDTWRAAKTTALALHALATMQFPLDKVEIIAFANLARVIAPHELPDLDANEIQGTNLQHALMLAGRFFDRNRDADPVCLVITDGEPTAHLQRDGDWWFSWPPTRETVALTLAEVDRMTQRRVPLSFFRLGDDPRLAQFLDDVAHRNRGRVLAADSERLGASVVADYVKSRSGARSRR